MSSIIFLFPKFIFPGGVVAHPDLLETYQTQFRISYENFVHFFGNVFALVDSSHLTQACCEDCSHHFCLNVLADDNACASESSFARSVSAVSPNGGNDFFANADCVENSFNSFASVMKKMIAVSVSSRHFVVPLSFCTFIIALVPRFVNRFFKKILHKQNNQQTKERNTE